jgi:hypothetical protein
MEETKRRCLDVPEEPDVEDANSEDDWARGKRESRGSLTFYTAARRATVNTLSAQASAITSHPLAGSNSPSSYLLRPDIDCVFRRVNSRD